MYEIERKFLVDEEKLPAKWDKEYIIKQAYLMITDKGTTRIRQQDDKYILTIKMKDEGIKQVEIERDLTKEEFDLLWSKTNKKIEKTRRISGRWEVDYFHNLIGMFENLVMAEIELSSESENIELPEWIGLELTGQSDFYNTSLIDWSKDD